MALGDGMPELCSIKTPGWNNQGHPSKSRFVQDVPYAAFQ